MTLQVDLTFVSQQKETLNKLTVRSILHIPGSKLIATYIGGASGTSELIWRNLWSETRRVPARGSIHKFGDIRSYLAGTLSITFFFEPATYWVGAMYPSMTRIRGQYKPRPALLYTLGSNL